jgi:predicted Zn-dependent peptidase
MKRIYSLEEFGVKKHEMILSNGLKTIFIEKPFAPISANIEIGAGSIFNPFDNGLAHFTEHIIVSASQKYPRKDLIARLVNPIGGKTNAHTSLKLMSVECEIVLPEHLSNMKEYFSEVLCGLYMTPTLFEKEQGVIVAEIAKDTSRQGYVGGRHIRNIVTKGTAWGHSNLGTADSVKSLTQKEVLNFFQTYCVVENMTLIVSGGCSVYDIEKTFGGIPLLSGGKKTVLPSDPCQFDSNERIFYQKDTDETHVNMLFNCPKMGTRESLILAFVLAHAHAGLDSRFYNRLRNEKGLVYSLGNQSIDFDLLRYSGTFFSVPSDKVDRVIEATIECYQELKQEPMSELDIKERIDRLYFNDRRNLQRSVDWVGVFDDCFYEDKFQLVKDYPDIYNFMQTIRAEEVKKILEDYIDLDNFHLIVHGRDPGQKYF